MIHAGTHGRMGGGGGRGSERGGEAERNRCCAGVPQLLRVVRCDLHMGAGDEV